MAPKNILVWDFSLRFFHWAFAASLVAALGLAFVCDKHHALFAWHMLFGLAATAWIGGLFANHDPAAARVRLPLTGTFIQLGESDGGVKARVKERRKHRDDHN